MIPPVFELQPHQDLHLYLRRGDCIRVVQGQVELVSRHWLAERCVPMVLPLQTEGCYQADAAGWVQLRAVMTTADAAGAAVQMLSAPVTTMQAKIKSQFYNFRALRPCT